MKKYYRVIILCVFISLGLVGCRTENSNQEELIETTAVSYTEEQKKVIDEGFEVDGYRMFLTKKNKKSPKDIENFISNDYYKDSIINVIPLIDTSKKLNIVTYGMQYSPEESRYTLGIFFINTSETIITKLEVKVKPIFKTLGSAEEFVRFSIQEKDFLNLPPNGMISGTISGDIPREYVEKLKENTAKDITFEIKDLEINGEKVDNLN